MRPLGAVFARGNEVKSLLGGLGVVLVALGSLLGRLEAVLGRSWAVLSRSWAVLGRSWAVLGRSWGDLGSFSVAPWAQKPSFFLGFFNDF